MMSKEIYPFIHLFNKYVSNACCVPGTALFCSYNREQRMLHPIRSRFPLRKFPPSSMRLKGFSGFCWQGQRQSCCNSQWPLSRWPFKSKRCKHLIKACNDMKVNFIDLKIVFKKIYIRDLFKKIFKPSLSQNFTIIWWWSLRILPCQLYFYAN